MGSGSEKSGNFIFVLLQGFAKRVSLLANIMSFQKISTKELISAASSQSLLPKDLSRVISEKSGDEFQPWTEKNNADTHVLEVRYSVMILLYNLGRWEMRFQSFPFGGLAVMKYQLLGSLRNRRS